MADPTPTHGGRRHGLAPSGRARRLSVPLAPAGWDALEVLAARWECSQAEVVRRLLHRAAGRPSDLHR